MEIRDGYADFSEPCNQDTEQNFSCLCIDFLPPYLSPRDLDARNVIPENQMIYEQGVIALQLVPFCFLLCLCPLQNMKVMFCWLYTVWSHTV